MSNYGYAISYTRWTECTEFTLKPVLSNTPTTIDKMQIMLLLLSNISNNQLWIDDAKIQKYISEVIKLD